MKALRPTGRCSSHGTFVLLARFLSAAILVCSLLSGSTPSRADSPAPLPTDRPASEVGTWIEKLGHPSYAVRVRAREQLQRMGLQAFDELYAAQFHADSEIAMAARHLVSSLLVSWSTDTDPEPVRDALNEYGAQTETERQNRMDRLAELPDRQGLAALCRLVRFETSLRLSHEAALAVMRYPLPESTEAQARDADTIRIVLGPNDRRGADWLRAYADDLELGSYSAERWRKLIREQRLEMDGGADSTASRPTVLELVQVCATRAVTAGLKDEAMVLTIEHLDLIPPRAREVIDACSWAIDNGTHSIVLELQKRHPELFQRQPILLYGAAESMLALNDSASAERLANQALGAPYLDE